jgi:hypothetical protein
MVVVTHNLAVAGQYLVLDGPQAFGPGLDGRAGEVIGIPRDQQQSSPSCCAAGVQRSYISPTPPNRCALDVSITVSARLVE